MLSRTILLLLSLVSPYPHAQSTRLILSQRHAIAHLAEDAATAHGIPVELLLAVGYHETWCGTHPHEGGNWGAPRPHQHDRHLAGTADDAAAALARSIEVCGGSLRGAIGRFRSGLCRPWNPAHRAYVERVVGTIRRLHRAAGTEPPTELASARPRR